MCAPAQSCPTLCNPVDCSPPTSSVHGISSAGILEWFAISSSRGSSQPRDRTQVSCSSCIDRQILYHCTTWEYLLRGGGKASILTGAPKGHRPSREDLGFVKPTSKRFPEQHIAKERACLLEKNLWPPTPQDLSSPVRDGTCAPCFESLNHWTSREVPKEPAF